MDHVEQLGGQPALSLRPSCNPPSSVALNTPASEHDVHDTLRYGFRSAKADINPAHPLQASEANYAANKVSLEYSMLRTSFGLHVPLKLHMERRMASEIQRMPPLQSSMIALETLLGEDTTIGVEELLNPSSSNPAMVNGRAMMEKKMNLKH